MARPAQWPPQIYYHRRSGRDRIRVNGVDYYLGPHGSEEARAEYARLVNELVAQGKAGHARARPEDAPQGFTVSEVLARWWAYAETYYSDRGREKDNIGLALEPLERLFGHEAAADFDEVKLEELQQAMLTGSWMAKKDRKHPRRPKSGGWSRGVVNRRIIKVRTVWRWAEKKKLVPKGTWSSLRTVQAVLKNRPGARDIARKKTTTMAEVRAVCRHLKPIPRAMLLVQWWTGMRSCEVRLMRASDVLATEDCWVYRPQQHKTDYLGHDRVVMLGRRAVAALRPWLEAAKKIGPDAYVFPSAGKGGHQLALGQCYTCEGYAQAIRRAVSVAGLDGWHAYLCRHATRMRVSREHGDEAARSVLGQKHLDVTLGYGELDLDLARQVQRKLG